MFISGDERCDTIAACASARAAGPRAILRIAGSQALSAAARLDPSTTIPETGHSVAPMLFDILGIRVAGFIWVFRAPRSYTGDDLVELHIPASLPLIDALMSRLTEMGIRPARPGEMTRRAFLAGKIDLTRAEAIQVLATTDSEQAARSAIRGLRGDLLREISTLRSRLFEALCHVEAAVDFAHEDLEREWIGHSGIDRTLTDAREAIEALLRREQGREAESALPRVVLLGPQNAGKSSLMNALCDRSISIVSSVAGTTRDTVSAVLDLGPYSVEILDSAGVNADEVDCAVESPTSEGSVDAEAMRRARRSAESADLTLVVVDGSEEMSRSATELRQHIPEGRCIVVVQKSDLVQRASLSEQEGIRVSALTGEGLSRLRQKILDFFASQHQEGGTDGARSAPNARHRGCLVKSRDAITKAQELLSNDRTEDLAAFELRSALESIEEITGLSACSEDVLDRIFSTFCLGK